MLSRFNSSTEHLGSKVHHMVVLLARIRTKKKRGEKNREGEKKTDALQFNTFVDDNDDEEEPRYIDDLVRLR